MRLCAAQLLRSVLAARPQQVRGGSGLGLLTGDNHPKGVLACLHHNSKPSCDPSAGLFPTGQATKRQGGYALRAVRKFMTARGNLQVSVVFTLV